MKAFIEYIKKKNPFGDCIGVNVFVNKVAKEDLIAISVNDSKIVVPVSLIRKLLKDKGNLAKSDVEWYADCIKGWVSTKFE